MNELPLPVNLQQNLNPLIKNEEPILVEFILCLAINQVLNKKDNE